MTTLSPELIRDGVSAVDRRRSQLTGQARMTAL